jgi:hypothetical protein
MVRGRTDLKNSGPGDAGARVSDYVLATGW